MIGSVILGILTIGVGFIFILKTDAFLNNFGRLPFFETHLATSGGSRLGYKLIGLALIVLGFIIATGLIGSFMGWLLSPLTRYSQ